MAASLVDYFFSTGSCPGLGLWVCEVPHACARDSSTGRGFCCNWNEKSGPSQCSGQTPDCDKALCWSQPTTCATDGSTFQCQANGASWCCLDDTEICTPLTWQTNVCVSKGRSALGDTSSQVINGFFSSLSSANPSATTWPFDPETGSSTSDSYAGSLPTTASYTYPGLTSTPGATSSDSNLSADVHGSSSKKLSRGAIGGIVGGVVAVIALIAGWVGFFLKKRRQQGNTAPGTTPEKSTDMASGVYPGGPQGGGNNIPVTSYFATFQPGQSSMSSAVHPSVSQAGYASISPSVSPSVPELDCYQALHHQSVFEVDGNGLSRQELPAGR